MKSKKNSRKNQKTKKRKYPKRYIPNMLTQKDKKKQKSEIMKSQNMYKDGKYHTRDKIKSFKSKQSKHIENAYKMYGIKTMKINKHLVSKTGCSLTALRKIYKKGQGAYYSSGSRPNQTADSWAYARVASAITGGKSSAIDYNLLESGCKKNSKALKLAKKALKTYKKGKMKTPKITL